MSDCLSLNKYKALKIYGYDPSFEIWLHGIIHRLLNARPKSVTANIPRKHTTWNKDIPTNTAHDSQTNSLALLPLQAR